MATSGDLRFMLVGAIAALGVAAGREYVKKKRRREEEAKHVFIADAKVSREKEEHKKRIYEAIKKNTVIDEEERKSLSIIVSQLASLGLLQILTPDDIEKIDQESIGWLKEVSENGLLYMSKKKMDAAEDASEGKEG